MNGDRLARLIRLETTIGRRAGGLAAQVAAAAERLIAWTNAATELPLAEIRAGHAAVRDAIDRARAR